ncbi:MAG TPA: hypothetical protein VI318_18020 [Baekduia sp.]
MLLLGSALLFISLFLRWYDTGPTGWEVFESLDLVLAALAAAGVFAAVRPDATAPWAAIGIPGAAVLIVFVQLVNAPPAAAGANPSSGAWLALAGALLMAGGAALSLAAISITVSVREHDIRRRVPAVDRRHRATEDDVAEDLDADAEGPAPPRPRMPSLLGGLGHHREPDEDDPPPPPRGTGRFAPREAAGDEQAAATAHRAASARRPHPPEGDDLERTQPLTGLPDEEDSERP